MKRLNQPDGQFLLVSKKWNANTAILSGDSMLVLAYDRMAQCDDKHLAKVMKLFTTSSPFHWAGTV